ncbi:MAG: hypothetical protein KJN71_07160 [Acidimicrobiia bacterium]|nr:hypothetical protein [Acidimicrobiia bacterium]NNC75835.1 hypothetical protein [Acidimicrobiia bacterium]
MGQQIEISSVVTLDSIALFETDRSITGQDGIGYDAAPEDSTTPPADLAVRLFDAVPGLERVYVASNQVTAKRATDWDEDSLATAKSVISGLFVHYVAN